MPLKIFTLIMLFVAPESFAQALPPTIKGKYTKGLIDPFEKMTIKDKNIEIANHQLYIVNFTQKTLDKIKISNSEIISLNLQNKIIQTFEAQNVVFESARFTATKFKKCLLKNVVFINSDLNFTNIKNCQHDNVKFSNTVSYEISNYN